MHRERPGEVEGVRQVHLAAFSGEAEADIAYRLRSDGDILLSLVALVGGAIVGNVILSAMDAEADDKPLKAIALGPIGVMPARQQEGIGGALMHAAIDWARDKSYAVMFLLGDPRYYARFGFSTDAAKPFVSPYAGPHWQALILDEQFVLPKAGRADYARAFTAFEDE